MSDLREQILAADDLGSEDVDVPEWGDGLTLKVRGLNAGEVEEFGRAVNEGKLDNLLAKMVAKVVMNGDGERVFTDDDVDALAAKSHVPIQRIFQAAQRVSGLDDDEEATDAKN